VDRIFHALADSTRRDIVRRVLDGEWSVSALAREYPMSFAAVQKHVAVLERAELVTKERRGREQLVHPNLQTVRRAAECSLDPHGPRAIALIVWTATFRSLHIASSRSTSVAYRGSCMTTWL